MKTCRNRGFTLTEMIVVIAIVSISFGVVLGAGALNRSNDARELKAIQNALEEAIVGYYGILGIYPVGTSGVTMHPAEVELSPDEVAEIANQLMKYSGFSFIPSVVIEKYKFHLYYPQEYIFKIRVEKREKGTGWETMSGSGGIV